MLDLATVILALAGIGGCIALVLIGVRWLIRYLSEMD